VRKGRPCRGGAVQVPGRGETLRRIRTALEKLG